MRLDEALQPQVDAMLAEQKTARDTDALGELPKHGFATGRFAVNPFNGESIPIWVANYVLSGLRHGRDHERACARRARL